MILEKAIFVNRAPFERLELDFKEKGVNVLTAINGKGKTTIITYIVDALYEAAKKGYRNQFEGTINKYYRVSSGLNMLKSNSPSIVYLRFKEGKNCHDYVDAIGTFTQNDYSNNVKLDNIIPFHKLENELLNHTCAKIWSDGLNAKNIKNIFDENVLTYFPAYRYEQPIFLNDPYSIHLDFTKDSKFSGYLINPIEVISGIQPLTNWMLDILLDKKLAEEQGNLAYDNQNNPYRKIIETNENIILDNINKIISSTLFSKNYDGVVRIGVGPRNSGISRISIENYDTRGNHKTICPTLFALSSGESALLSIFVEILRQADNNQTNIPMHEISGIVLIDEVDKHLHISLQKEVLPKMFKLFPNVQFIVSSHSPFLNMGLADDLPDDNQIIDLDNGGLISSATTNSQYQEVYEMMLGEKQKYAELYHNLKNKIKQDSKPLIVTEGKTDSKHIKAALKRLNINLDVEFYEIGNQEWGNSNLYDMLDQISKVKQNRVIIGVFDRDSQKYIDYCNANTSNFKEITPGNNVYAFCIPLVNETLYGNEISIEHYYNRNDLLKKDSNGRRLFLGDEFFPSANSKDGKYQTKIKQIQHKIDCCGIIDDKVYSVEDLEQKTNIALTKNDFADLVLNTHFSDDFDFSSFTKIIDIVKEIIATHDVVRD
ncbi:MAG: AAA family ATPase [Paludibacteraceae bacterium]|nr:AAA family ATPase [Paludibacteraceae bacterium]